MTNVASLILSLFCVNVALGALVPVDDFSRNTLDELVRRKLIFMVLNNANDTIKAQTQLKHQCEVSVNQTITQCNTCAAAHQQTPPPQANILDAVLPILILPLSKTGELMKDVEGSIVDAANLMGDQAKHFVNDVGSVAKNAGESLIDGTKDIANSAAKGLIGLGDNIAHLATDLGSGLEHTVHLIGDGTLNLGSDIGHSLESFGNTLGQGAQGALDGINDLGNQISHAGQNVGHAIEGAVGSVGHAIGSIFGKRLAIRSVCPSCDKINTETKQPQQIISDVCGADKVKLQHDLLVEIQKMKVIYDTAVKSPVITKIEYDPASIDTSSGVAFKTVWVTYMLSGQSTRYQASAWYRLTSLPTTANELSEEIFSR